ncbi:MAG: DUF3721 domain-containing protein [Chitinophagaceae bacterium]|nr:DUF3721 domain-containing protein [Chitinophagaceae bacterium]
MNPPQMNHLFSHLRIVWIRRQRFALAASALFTVVQLPTHALAHAKGMYKTRAEAEKRAKELGCKGTHQNNGLWMPCSGEAMLHKELRQE